MRLYGCAMLPSITLPEKRTDDGNLILIGEGKNKNRGIILNDLTGGSVKVIKNGKRKQASSHGGTFRGKKRKKKE